MKLEGLFELRDDEKAVSPVIGVILMVAITVILAAVIGTFVLGLGQEMNKNAPTTQLSFDQAAGNNPTDVTLSHDGGDKLKKGEVSIVFEPQDTEGLNGAPLDDWESKSGSTEEITAGESVTLKTDGTDTPPDFQSGDVIKVVWTASDGGTSQVLREYEVN
jgi:flagellin-like protein